MRTIIVKTIVATCLCACMLCAAESRPAEPPGALLQRGTEKLKKGEYAAGIEDLRRAYLVLLPDYRELPFKSEVPASFMDRGELREKLLGLFADEYPDEKIARETLAYAHLGFFKPGFDLKATMLDVMGEEIGGFYDPKTKQLFCIKSPEAKKRGGLLGLFGDASGTDPQEVRAVLSHEMAHALADQHFELEALEHGAEGDDDMLLALTALFEGDATAVMLIDASGPNGKRAVLESPGMMAFAMELSVSLAAPFASGKAFNNAPLIVKEQLLFPYVKGLAFCLRLTAAGGWRKVNAAFADPPVSTEQILHPEKYAGPARDLPLDLRFAEGPPLAARAWELIEENTLGEFGIEVLLREKLGSVGSRPAAAGWDGDRFRVYRRKEGEARDATLLVWVTTWDTEEDARQFEAALLARYAPAPAEGKDSPRPNAWSNAGAASRVTRAGQDVLFLDRVPEDLVEPLSKWAASGSRAEKRFPGKKRKAWF